MEITELEAEVLKKIRESADFASIRIEKQAGKIRRVVVEESFMLVI